MTYWKKHILSFLLLSFFSISARSQNCNIVAKNNACIGEPLGFQVQSSMGTPISYSWDFAGAGTSTGASPTFIFNAAGYKTVTVTLNFAGGLSCNASLVIKINEIPQALFFVDSVNNIYCRNSSLICLDDVTQRSASDAPLKQRITVWGDGALGQNLDPENDRYECHHYFDTGVYEITMEITDTNGCKTSYRRDVRIVPDLIAKFTYTITNTCDSVRVCFNNTSIFDAANPPRFRWYPGDGTVDTTTFIGYCKSFRNSGSFKPSLYVYNQYGCDDSTWADDDVNVDIPQITLTKDKSIVCRNGAELNLSATFVTNADYTWMVQDSAGKISIIKSSGGLNTDKVNLPTVGKWYVYVLVQIGGCIRKSQVDTVIVKGPQINIAALNSRQCTSKDTVYFCLEKDFYRSNINTTKFFWNFGDQYASQCTEDKRKNQNVGMNCNFSADSGNVKHFYKGDTCFNASLFVIDTISQCKDEAKLVISMGPPDAGGMKVKTSQPCWSVRRPVEYGVKINVDSLKPACGVSKILINVDSARHPNNWQDIAVTNPSYIYDSVADDSGWITIGLIAKMGEPDVYSGCVNIDPNDTGQVCTDTVWYHKIFRLLPEPKPLFFLNKNNGCNPLDVTVRMDDSTQAYIQKVIYSWGDYSVDTIRLNPNDRRIPPFSHKYKTQGIFFLRVTLENENECQHSYMRRITVGYFKKVDYDTIVCRNMEMHFTDSVEYWDALTGHWEDQARADSGLEKIWWRFGDGTTDTGHAPVKIYKDTGLYIVTMLTSDSANCVDSIRIPVYVVGVNAGIKNMALESVCNEIVTFFDSSRRVGLYPGDSIYKHWWDFGDKKIPSVLKNPTHAYTSFGTFEITHVVENIKGCIDTARITISMKGPVPFFSFLSDSIGCVPFTIKLDNRSDTSSIRDYIWDFNDVNNSTISTQSDSNVSFTYVNPGTYYLKLTGAKNIYSPATGNVYYCKAVYPDVPTHLPRKVVVLPIPQAAFTMPDTVCPGEKFNLIDNSDPKYKIYVWHFPKDSLKSSNPVVSHSIDSSGDFKIIYTPYYIPGAEDRYCLDTVTKNIHVSRISADFDIDSVLSEDPKFFFRNKSSSEAVSYIWNFGHTNSNDNSSFTKDAFHNFDPDTGIFVVCLRAVNEQGCEDTVCKQIHINYFPHVRYYNVFTPGGSDSFNNVFDIDIKGESYYKLKIYNRWGSLVFESDEDGNENDGKNWNGRKFNTGDDCPAGTYFYIFEYRILQGKQERVFGTCTLIRDK